MRHFSIIFIVGTIGVGQLVLAQIPSTRPAASDSEVVDSRGNNRSPSRTRNFSAVQMRRIEDALQVSDDEWRIIQPKIERIESIRREIQASRFGGRARRADARRAAGAPVVANTAGQATGAELADLQDASQQLQEALNNKDTKPEEIKAKLAALRAARAHAQDELTKAQDQLRDLLTARQEAILVASFNLLN